MKQSPAAALLAACAAVATMLVPAAAPASPKPAAVLATPGGDYARREADRATCKRIANDAPIADMPDVDRAASPLGGAAPNGAAVAGEAIVALMFLLIDNGRAENAGVAFCMQNLGYSPVPLTDGEAAEYNALPIERRAAWEQAFLSRDLTRRLANIQAPQVPPLPPYRDEPATLGGLRYKVAGFTAAPGAVGKGGTLLTGQVERWRTAVLAADFATDVPPGAGGKHAVAGAITIAGKAGSVFHQVDYRSQRHPLLRQPGATWCGPVLQSLDGANPAPSVYCLSTRREGYAVFHPAGFGWLAGPLGDGFVLPLLTRPVQLEERAADDLGSLDFTITATEVSASAVTLDGVVTRSGQRVHVWTRRLKFRDGRIVVPLWQRRLLITPVAAARPASPAAAPPPVTVTAVLDDAGDGKGLRDAW